MKHAGVLRLLPTREDSARPGILITHLLLPNSNCLFRSDMAVQILTIVPKIHLTTVHVEVVWVRGNVDISFSFLCLSIGVPPFPPLDLPPFCVPLPSPFPTPFHSPVGDSLDVDG